MTTFGDNDSGNEEPQPPKRARPPAPPPPYAKDDPNPYQQPTPADALPDHDDNEQAVVEEEYSEPEDVVANSKIDIAAASAHLDRGDSEYTVFLSDYGIRTAFIALMFCVFCILTFSLWLYPDIDQMDKDLQTAYSTAAAGDFMIFFSSIIAFIIGVSQIRDIDLPFRDILLIIGAILYVAGGAIYMIGTMAVAATWNDLFGNCNFLPKKNSGYCSSYAGLWFIEGFLVGAYAIIYGIDLWKQFMTRVPLRIYVNIFLFGFVTLVAFFIYAVLSTNVGDLDGDNDSLGIVAAGYFFMCVLLVIYFLFSAIEYLRVHWKTQVFDLLLALFFLAFGLLAAIGYWSLVGGDGVGYGGGKYGKAVSVYFVGVSIVVLFISFFIACDMQIGKYFSRFADVSLQAAASEDNTHPPQNQNDYDPDQQYGDEQ